jgi:hypothetical protein
MRTVSNLEGHRIRRPHSSSLRKLADALGLSARASAELRRRFQSGDSDGAGQHRRPVLIAAPADGGPSPVPRQLPSTAPFVGRAAELAQLDRWLTEARKNAADAAIFGIGGMAGVGKTALALCWAHRVAAEFPDGQLFVTLGSSGQVGWPTDTADALGGILIALGTAHGQVPDTLAARAELYRRLATDRKLLIVIDNAQDAAQVETLAPRAAGCLAVMTSRIRLTELAAAGAARLVNLDLPAASEAVQLLIARLGADRAREDPQAVRELVRLCGRLPLALAIVAARAATSGWRLALIAAQLADSRQRLDALDLGDSATDMRSVFAWSCQQVSLEALGLLRLMASLPGTDFAAIPGADQWLAELARASLITEHQPGRFWLHDLLRLYVTESASLARIRSASGAPSSA